MYRFTRLTILLLVVTCVPVFASDRVITPNENLVVEGIPPIPETIAENVGPYTEFRAAGLSSWHPTRREILIQTRFADTTQVHRVTSPGGVREQLTFFPERVQSASYQPTAGEYFVFSKDLGGNENSQIFRYDLATGKSTLLTDGTSRNDRGPWSTAGDRIVYRSNRRSRGDSDFYVIDPTNPASNRMVTEIQGGGWFPADWSPDDTKILAFEYISINESYLWLVDVTSGEKTLLTPKGGAVKVSYGGAQYSKDGKGIYVTTDKDSEFQRLAYMDLATKNLTFLTTDLKWDVEDFDISDDGKTIAYVANENGIGVVHVYDIQSRKDRTLSQIPKGVIGGVSWHKNGKDLGFTLSAARSPSDPYSIDVTSGKIDRWVESETGGLRTENFSEPELITWTSFDGREISGFLYRPPATFTGKRPVIINIHGGPEGQYRPGFLGSSNYYLNELGIALIYPNVRGSAGYGKTFLTLDNAYKREDSVKDIGALLDWIAKEPSLDSNRILVTGGSYGGYMSLAVATLYNTRISAAIDIVGISNFVSFLEKTEAYRQDLRRAEYGDERDPKMREFLLSIAPLNRAKMITKPLFVIQGQNDPRVPLNEAEQIVATLKGSNTPVWYLMAKDEGHGFAKKKNRDFQFYATIMFIKQHLLG